LGFGFGGGSSAGGFITFFIETRRCFRCLLTAISDRDDDAERSDLVLCSKGSSNESIGGLAARGILSGGLPSSSVMNPSPGGSAAVNPRGSKKDNAFLVDGSSNRIRDEAGGLTKCLCVITGGWTGTRFWGSSTILCPGST
jgi:hypothetical protein